MKTINIDLRAPHAAFGVVGACLVDYFLLRPHRPMPAPDEPQLALVETLVIVIAVGLALAAGALLAKRAQNPLVDDTQPNLAQRGAIAPRVLGQARVGPIICWVGDRFTTKEKTSGGKGGALGGSPKATIYREAGLHVLAVGPGRCLRQILQNGKVIFDGPINPASHPSGTSVDVGNEGTFTIYWGETDDTAPLDTFLGASTRLGITSRWPGFFRVVWTNKRLGTSPTWPQLNYIIECEPQESENFLTLTNAYMPATFTPTGTTHAIEAVTNGAQGTGFVEVDGDLTNEFDIKDQVEIAGNTGLGSTQTFTIHNVKIRLETIILSVTPLRTIEIPKTQIFPEGGLTGATADGTAEALNSNPDDGINPAHIVAELLFAQHPHGMGRSTAFWDLNTLETLGQLMETEGIQGHIVMTNGQRLNSQMASLMQDLGFLLPIDQTTGLIKVRTIREPSGTLPNISEDLFAKDLPEVEVLHDDQHPDRMVFSFLDRENQYRSMTLSVDADGTADFENRQNAETVQINSTVNFGAASVIAQRRSQEELAGGQTISIKANRGARVLEPGEAITADGINEVLRVSSIKTDPLSGLVTVGTIVDYYGAAATNFQPSQGNPSTPPPPVQQDLQFQPFEVPEQLLNGEPQTVLVPRIRAHSGVVQAGIHISRDNSTYTYIGDDLTLMSGGTLLDAIKTDTPLQVATPRITLKGPDAGDILDLSTDETSWRNGRQLIAMVTAAGKVEIGFLRKVTALGGGVYELNEILRNRYNTEPLEFDPGDEVYILQDTDGLAVQDPLIEPQVLLYSKTQPQGSGTVSLASVGPRTINLYGKGVRPMPVSNIRLDIEGAGPPRTTFTFKETGGTDDLNLRWMFATPRTPSAEAGGFPGGNPYSDPGTPEGDFIVKFLTTGDVLKRTKTVTTNTVSYPETERSADMGLSTSFKVRVTQRREGLLADPVTVTIQHVP